MVKIKFCGLTDLEDARMAVEVGADLLGFNFYAKSPRCISRQTCAEIIAGLGASMLAADRPIRLVGIFVNHPASEVNAIMQACRLDLAQLSGDETPQMLQQVGRRAYKAIRLGMQDDLEAAIFPYPLRQEAPALLIDASVPGAYGGTGQVADWKRARQAASNFPILLAGGLTPENAADAVQQVQPWGVDVASGIESSPGRKDPARMAAFVQAVRRAEATT